MSISFILIQLDLKETLLEKACVNTFSLTVLTGDDVLGAVCKKCEVFNSVYTPRRLSGTKVNLTVHESAEAGDKVMDVRLRMENAVINIRYETILDLDLIYALIIC